MDGGDGNDTYIINQSQGFDIIDDSYGGGDVLSFGSGITWANTAMYRFGSDVAMKLAGGGMVVLADGLGTLGKIYPIQNRLPRTARYS